MCCAFLILPLLNLLVLLRPEKINAKLPTDGGELLHNSCGGLLLLLLSKQRYLIGQWFPLNCCFFSSFSSCFSTCNTHYWIYYPLRDLFGRFVRVAVGRRVDCKECVRQSCGRFFFHLLELRLCKVFPISAFSSSTTWPLGPIGVRELIIIRIISTILAKKT